MGKSGSVSEQRRPDAVTWWVQDPAARAQRCRDLLSRREALAARRSELADERRRRRVAWIASTAAPVVTERAMRRGAVELERARVLAGMSVTELWKVYFARGGEASLPEVRAIL